MSKTEVGKDTSLHAGVSFQTLRELLKQREALDRQILRQQGKLFRLLERKTSSRRKKYVARMNNTAILVEAVRKCMVPGHKMTMEDILKSLRTKKLYHTRSGYLYTMVNNKLNGDKRIKKVSRGVFVLQKTG